MKTIVAMSVFHTHLAQGKDATLMIAFSSLVITYTTLPWRFCQIVIYAFVANDCYNRTGGRARNNQPQLLSGIFSISNTRNKFMAIGCDTYAVIKGSRGTNYTTGCMSLCDSTRDVV